MDEAELPVTPPGTDPENSEGLQELHELQELMQELASVLSIEALPVEALPAHAIAASGWVTRLLLLASRYAPLLAFFGALVENTAVLGFLLPGGTAVVLAGAGARAAGVPLPLVVGLAAAGMAAGAVVDYFLGRAGATRLLRHPRAGRLGARMADELERTAPMLRHHGWWMMLLAHAFGHGRSSMAVAAGGSGLPLRRFLMMEAPAALLWGALYAGGGYFLAAEWSRLELVLRRAGWLGAGVFALGCAVWLTRRHLIRREQRLRGPTCASPTFIATAGPVPQALCERTPQPPVQDNIEGRQVAEGRTQPSPVGTPHDAAQPSNDSLSRRSGGS